MYLSTVTCDGCRPGKHEFQGPGRGISVTESVLPFHHNFLHRQAWTKIGARIEADWMQMISDDTRDRQESEIIWVICAKYNQLTTLAPLLPQLHFEGPTPPQSASVCREAGLRSRPDCDQGVRSHLLAVPCSVWGRQGGTESKSTKSDFSVKFGTMFLDAPWKFPRLSLSCWDWP